MRCLQCGSALSAFKKLTDGDFCSAEHRDSFYEAQQQLIINRLKQSAQRFQRLHPHGGAVSAVRVAPVEPIAALPPELKAPAPMAAYMAWQVELQERLFDLHATLEFNFSTGAARPRLSAAASTERRRLSQLIPDFPWALYNPGLRWFSSLLENESATEPQITSFVSEGRSADAFPLQTSGLLTPSLPEIANRPSLASRIALRMARPKPRICLDPLRLAAASQRLGIGYCGLQPQVALASIAPPPTRAFLEAAPIALAASFGIPGSLRLSADFQAKGMAFLDRVYRMRPRMGVTSDRVPSIRSLDLEPFAPGSAKAFPAVTPKPHSSLGLAFANRFTNSRPAGPVAANTASSLFASLDPAVAKPGRTAISLEAPVAAIQAGMADARLLPVTSTAAAASTPQRVTIEAGAPLSGAAPAFPGSIPAISAEPARGDRFFRPRPRGPVEADLAAFQPLSGQPEDWQAAPTVGSVPAGGIVEPSPAMVTRMFRMRPKTGVNAETTKVFSPQLEPCAAKPSCVAKPTAERPELSVGVAFADRPYGTHPQSALASETPAYAAISTGDAGSTITATPALPALVPETTQFEPAISTRVARSRAGYGVMDSALAASLGSQTEVEVLQSSPSMPSVSLGECSPALVDRMFRPRPRSGVGLETAAVQDAIGASAADFVGTANIPNPSFPAQSLSPALLDKLFRGRAKTGVLASNVADWTPSPVATIDFATKPVATLQNVPDCVPAFANRLFRFRPKAAVDAIVRLETSCAAAEPFPAGKPEFMPDWWDVLHGAKPAFVNKMYRMRLKNPAQDEDTVTRDIRTRHIPVPDPDPVLATLPPPTPPAEPSFLDRLYRMRPRGGKASEPAANAIPCAAIDPRLNSGIPKSVLQSVSRQWKATPLSVKSLAVTLPLMLMLAVFPWSRPAESATRPLREAMIRRAAIDRAPTFTEGLSQWRGAKRWKQTASGAIEPAGLALFEPSLRMRNYRFTFAAQVHKGGVGFVVRAADEHNYQAVKLKIVKPGPLPVVRVVRWTVVDGIATERQETPLPMTVSADTQYRVAVDVNEQSFTLMVQDQLVDSWSVEQLKTGGAGFFGDKGERASVHSVRMTHQDDAIGKLFAAIALPEIASN